MDAGFGRFHLTHEEEMSWRELATQARAELASCLHSEDMPELARKVSMGDNRAAHLLKVQATGWQQLPLFQE
ncbi:hypothetical protein KC887_04390 [Candidatus Kaiserbacteria bacterium]|nr:hypothetical protein [Candidatus Kaiserbacteria bacterium]